MLFLRKITLTSKRQASVALFLLLLLTSTAFSLLSPIIAAADPGDGVPPASVVNLGNKSPETQATSFWYYQAVAECLKSASFDYRSEDKIKSGEWVAGGSNGSVAGYYMRDTLPGFDNDGRVNCNENGADGKSVIQSALKYWGLDPLTVACDTGVVKRSNNTSCLQGDGGFSKGPNELQIIDENQSSLLSYIRKNAFGSTSPSSLSKEASYIYNLNTFLKACAPGKSALTSDPGGSRVYKIKDKQGKDVWYIGTRDSEWDAAFRPNPNVEKKCKDLVNDINSYSINYLTWVTNNPDVIDGSDGTAGLTDCTGDACTVAPTCSVDAIGWIVCPVVNFLSGLVDTSYGVVKNLLTTPPLNLDTSSSANGAYVAWKIMRNTANIAFVVAFIIIIYSQLTGAGLNNYGIKKLLPKLIVAAILVNVSYWICALAVDASNVLGSSVKGLMDSVVAGLPAGGAESTDLRTGGAVWGPLAVIVLGTGVGALVGFSVFLPLLIAALAAIVTVVLVLVLRQALIIALIVISPLAFVALLLPNTEGLFKKWRVLSMTMLLMFPIIAFIFGASSLASVIIQTTTYSGNDAQAYGGNVLLQIVAAGIAIVPLFITPVVMKAAGGVLNRFAGIVNNPNKGVFDRMRKGAGNFRNSRKSAMRANRLNPNEGGNKYSRTWRRAAGVGTRAGNNLKARGDLNKAREEAADAGYMMNSATAGEASQLRMAASAANSARQAGALQGVSVEAQRAAVGARDDSNLSLEAAIRGQMQSGERQAIGEIEAQIAPESASQLGRILGAAIKSGDMLKAQAAQNRLSTMGNKGADVISETIASNEATGGNAKWSEMRTTLARNMSGSMMDKNEALKNWATQTEVTKDGELTKEVDVKDANGNIIGTKTVSTDVSLADHTKQLMEGINGQQAGGLALSADKFSKQTPAVQNALLSNNAVSEATINASLSANNVGTFDPAVVKRMEAMIAAGPNQPQQQQPAQNQTTPAPQPDPTTINIQHTSPAPIITVTTARTPPNQATGLPPRDDPSNIGPF